MTLLLPLGHISFKSPQHSTLSHRIWIWWKEDLSGKQLGKARDEDSYGWNGIY